MKIFDCHSHWGTKRGYMFRTEEELAQQEKIWKTKATYFTEDEQVDYFRKNNARVMLDLSFTKSLPIDEMRESHDYALDLQRANPDVIRALAAVRSASHAGIDQGVRRALAAMPGFIGLCVNGQVTRACRRAIRFGIRSTNSRWKPTARS